MDLFQVIYPLWCSYLLNTLEKIADYKCQSRLGIALSSLCYAKPFKQLQAVRCSFLSSYAHETLCFGARWHVRWIPKLWKMLLFSPTTFQDFLTRSPFSVTSYFLAGDEVTFSQSWPVSWEFTKQAGTENQIIAFHGKPLYIQIQTVVNPGTEFAMHNCNAVVNWVDCHELQLQANIYYTHYRTYYTT